MSNATRRAPECDREHRPAYGSEGLAVYSGFGVRKLARIAARVNQLYYADSLAVLREHIKGETVDLVSLDPPFLGVEYDGPEAFASAVEQGGRARPARRSWWWVTGRRPRWARAPCIGCAAAWPRNIVAAGLSVERRIRRARGVSWGE